MLGVQGLSLSRRVMEPGGTSVRLGLGLMHPGRFCIESLARLAQRALFVGPRPVLPFTGALLAIARSFDERNVGTLGPGFRSRIVVVHTL
jgi:hypothetical protein